MKLYYHPLSTYSRNVLIARCEKSISFTPEIVTLFDDTGREARPAIGRGLDTLSRGGRGAHARLNRA